MTANTKAIYLGAGRAEDRFDVSLLEEVGANSGRCGAMLGDFEDPQYSNEIVIARSAPGVKKADRLLQDEEGKGESASPPTSQVGGEFAAPAVGRLPLTFCTKEEASSNNEFAKRLEGWS